MDEIVNRLNNLCIFDNNEFINLKSNNNNTTNINNNNNTTNNNTTNNNTTNNNTDINNNTTNINNNTDINNNNTTNINNTDIKNNTTNNNIVDINNTDIKNNTTNNNIIDINNIENNIKNNTTNNIIDINNIENNIKNNTTDINNIVNNSTCVNNIENDEFFNNIFYIIKNNKYIKSNRNSKSNGKDFNSLTYLINRNITQSNCIKLGIAIESILKDIILFNNKNLIDIKPINKKDEKEKDHLFLDENNKIIFYAEVKSNLNLDTEKSKATINKCINIKNDLQKQYEGYNIKMFLLGVRYINNNIIPNNIKKKYNIIKNNIVGINEYFKFLNIHFCFENEEKYILFLNYIVDLIVK